MAEEINIHVATDLNTDKLPIKTINGVGPDSNGNIEVTNANDPNAVHKTGNETINGVKSFNDMIKATNGTVQVGADTGYSVTFNYNGNIVSKQARGTFNVFLPDANGTLALTSDIDSKANDSTVVHTSGTENISGNKIFRDVIFRKFDITTNTADIVYRFEDSNNSPCGSIQNNVHYWLNNLHNRHLAHNNTSGKEIYLDIISRNNGTGIVNIGGDVTSIENVTTVTSATDYSSIATMGWVNNPATSTNVVHRSGDETIAGNKTFSNKIKGNLQGNADSSTKASYLDNYSLPGGNKIYLDWNIQLKDYVGLKVDKTDMGGILTTKSITFVKFNNGWYRKHSDGFIEQFIYIDSTNSLSEMNVNFAIPFTTTNYHVSVIGSRTDSTDPSRTDDLIFTTCFKDKTYVNIYKFDGGENKYSTSMTVYVCGY